MQKNTEKTFKDFPQIKTAIPHSDNPLLPLGQNHIQRWPSQNQMI